MWRQLFWWFVVCGATMGVLYAIPLDLNPLEYGFCLVASPCCFK